MALLRLAARNLRRNRRRTLISLVALVVGVGAMVWIRGFINGQQQVILDNVVEGQTGALQVHKAGYLANVLASPLTLDFEDSAELRQKLEAVPGVRAVSPRILFGAMINTPDRGEEQGKTSFFLATAVDPAREGQVTRKRLTWIGQGRVFLSPDSNELLLNDDFARGLGIRVADPAAPPPPLEQWPALLAQTRDGTLSGENVRLGGTVLSVAPGDRKYGFVPLATGQKLLQMEGRITEYAIGIERFEDAKAVAAAAQAALGTGYEVHTWDELFPFIHELVGTQDFIFGIVSAIFLAVVLLGIVNAMLMSVLERVREIGTMLAVGMRRRQIIGLFVLEGGVLGLIGGGLGVAVGFAAVLWTGKMGIPMPAPGSVVDSIVRPVVSAEYLVQILLGAALGSALASLYPAMRASALRPVEALQSP